MDNADQPVGKGIAFHAVYLTEMVLQLLNDLFFVLLLLLPKGKVDIVTGIGIRNIENVLEFRLFAAVVDQCYTRCPFIDPTAEPFAVP